MKKYVLYTLQVTLCVFLFGCYCWLWGITLDWAVNESQNIPLNILAFSALLGVPVGIRVTVGIGVAAEENRKQRQLELRIKALDRKIRDARQRHLQH